MNSLLRTLTVIVALQSCQKGTDSTLPVTTDKGLPFNTAGNCHKELMVVSTLERSEGKIVGNTTVPPIIYAIELNQPQQAGQYQLRIFNPCNLPDTLKKVGQPVVVSGRVLTYGKDVESRMDIYGQPFDITAISRKE